MTKQHRMFLLKLKSNTQCCILIYMEYCSLLVRMNILEQFVSVAVYMPIYSGAFSVFMDLGVELEQLIDLSPRFSGCVPATAYTHTPQTPPPHTHTPFSDISIWSLAHLVPGMVQFFPFPFSLRFQQCLGVRKGPASTLSGILSPPLVLMQASYHGSPDFSQSWFPIVPKIRVGWRTKA